MIYRIYSTLGSFKELTFGPGLNILFADKDELANSKQTRNGAGKSSVLEIIHFLCAAECPDDSIFKLPQLLDHRFGMEFDLGGTVVAVERSGTNPREMIIRSSDTAGWPVLPERSDETGEMIMPLKSWERVLGTLMFGLEQGLTKSTLSYAPSFRSLFSYFVRRSPGGFTEPHLHFLQSKPGTWQVAISYLLGLDWTIAQEWQLVRDEEDEIKKLRSAVGEGDLAEIVGKKAELRSDIATQSKSLAKFKERIETFQVLPDFRDYEKQATALTIELSKLSTENTLDEELLADLESAVAEERAPQTADLEKVYREAGLLLAATTLKRFEDVRLFHESVLTNRRSYLDSEIKAAKARITQREITQRKLDKDRQSILELLHSHGALEQFSKLQSEYGRKTADLELLKKRFSAAEKIEGGLAKVKIRRQELLLRLQQDYSEQKDLLGRAIVAFQEISSQLYETPAKFTPTETTNGPQFKIEVQGERSPGIGNMQIYCFDMMLAQIAAQRNIGPRFLIHDSHLFDPVDARQVGTALEVGQSLAAASNFQYIVTFNSDKQIDSPKDFSLGPFTLPVKLTDATDTGGLFGLRFA
jgi:uncharacterized protein YydD (DUF2326 family)